jgi:hypothetical protein
LLAAAAAATAFAALAPAPLPLTGETPSGQRWRLEAGAPFRGDGVRPSWCLRLRFTTDITIDGDPFAGDASTCGIRPARRVSGAVVVDCSRDVVYVFGGARSNVRDLTVHPRRGPIIPATWAALPPRSGFSGRTFAFALDTRRLPARIEAVGAGRRVVTRLPSARRLCRPLPGAPDGGQPFGDFQTPR